jgi:hypothetical protein
VDRNDSSLGLHAALLYNMSTAVQDFYSDLKQRGIDQRVLSITFTEFGRRAYSNDSYGTDHGTATPVFVFGTQLNSGIYGVNPGLKEEELQRGNLVFNIDYRQIYTSIIQDWFEGDNEALVRTGFAPWVDQKIPIVATTGAPRFTPGRDPSSLHLYPNPVADMAQIQVLLGERGRMELQVLDASGRRVKSIRREGHYGPNVFSMDMSGLREGTYLLQITHRGRRYQTRFLKL